MGTCSSKSTTTQTVYVKPEGVTPTVDNVKNIVRMRACVFDAEAPSGVKLVERAMPKRFRGTVLVRVVACGVNPVDAKYIIGDKLPESWMAWCARGWHLGGNVGRPAR